MQRRGRVAAPAAPDPARSSGQHPPPEEPEFYTLPESPRASYFAPALQRAPLTHSKSPQLPGPPNPWGVTARRSRGPPLILSKTTKVVQSGAPVPDTLTLVIDFKAASGELRSLPSTVRMVCLANSRKHGGRCVAGFTWGMVPEREWVRPVTSYGCGELNWECLYTDCSDPKPLDIVELALLSSRPVSFHTEDCLVDSNQTWRKIGVAPFPQVAACAEPPDGPLWINAGCTANGINDRIPAEDAAPLRTSLKLIQPDRLTLKATIEGRERRKRMVRGSFLYGAQEYTLSVTDPVIEREFAAYGVGAARQLRRPLLCLSVSELFALRNEHYKLIAAVIEPN